MTYSFLGLSRRNLALIAIAGSLCSTSMGSGASPLSRHAGKSPLQSSWTYKTINDPYGSNTEVTGINNLSSSNGLEIVGNYISGDASTTTPFYSSFYASGPSYSTFNDASYPHPEPSPPGPQGTQMNAINSQISGSGSPVLAGIVYDPGDQAGNWAVVYNEGLWSLIKNPGSIGGTDNYSSYLYGINDRDVAVGYYTTKTSFPNKIAYFVAPPELYTDIEFPSSWTVQSSVAYGINDSSDMVGTVALNSSTSESWYAICCLTGTGAGKYCWQMLQDGSNPTIAYGINDPMISGTTSTRLVVGSYTSGNVTYGFLVRITFTSNKCTTGTFERIIEPKSTNLTVVRGINDEGDIVGYYSSSTTSTPILHGFVGTPTTGARHRR